MFRCKKVTAYGFRHFLKHCDRVRLFQSDGSLTNPLLSAIGRVMDKRESIKRSSDSGQHLYPIGEFEDDALCGGRWRLNERGGRLFYFLRQPTPFYDWLGPESSFWRKFWNLHFGLYSTRNKVSILDDHEQSGVQHALQEMPSAMFFSRRSWKRSAGR